MSKLINTLNNIAGLQEQLYQAKGIIQDRLNLVTGSFDYKFDGGNMITFNDRNYDLFNSDFFGDSSREWIIETAEVMSEQDFPVQLTDGMLFCKFFELTKNETELILSKCSTDEQYSEYLDYEYRNNEW